MKQYKFAFCAFLFAVSINSQNLEVQKKIELFNTKIQEVQKADRLQWMDSLSKLVYPDKILKYDSIVRKNIKFAISIDSINYAAEKVAHLIGYYNNFLGTPKEGVILYTDYFEQLKKDASFDKIGFLALNGADSYYFTGKIEKSLEIYELTKTYARKAENQKLLGYAILYIGDTESTQGEFVKASINLKEAARIFTRLKDTSNILSAKNSLSILYSKNAFYKEAHKERIEAILMAKRIKSYNNLRNLYFNASEDNQRTGNLVNQIVNLKKSLEANSKLKNAFLHKPFIITGLVKAFAQSDSLALAEENFKEIKSNYLTNKTPENRTFYVAAKKWISFGKGDYKNAVKYGHEYLHIKKQKKDYEQIMMAEKFLGTMYKHANDIENSNKHLLNYYVFNDSLSGIQNGKSLAYYQTLYETEKRDLKIENQKESIDVLNFRNKSKTQLLIFGSLGLLFIFGVVLFFRSFKNIKKRELAQQNFSQQLIITQEKERTRIAKDLHDGIGQQITLLKMKAQNNNQSELSLLAHNALEEVRSVSRDLYPVLLKRLGLTESVSQLLFDLDEETDLFISVEIEDINVNFNETESLNFYRFIQESVNNVIKHASAKTLIVNIVKHSNGIKILIKDNGKGFEVGNMIKKNSLGLKTMAERISMLKGNLSINSKKQEGTSILVQIPF